MKSARKVWVLAGLLILTALPAVSCDQLTNKEEEPVAVSFTGTWVGTLTISTTDPGACGGVINETFGITFVMTQTGDSVTGTVEFSDDPDGPEAFPSFTVSEGAGRADFGEESCNGTPGGTSHPLIDLSVTGTTMTATVSGTSCRGCPSGSGNEDVGTLSGGGTLTKQ